MNHPLASSSVPIEKPALSYYLKDYNECLAQILVSKKDDLNYVSSPTLNRQESLTHFYEKIEKYRQIRAFLERTGRSVCLEGKDAWLYPFLKREFPKLISTAEPRPNMLVQFLVFFKTWLKLFTKSLVIYLLGRFVKDRFRGDEEAVLRTYFDHRCVRKDGTLREEYFGEFTDDLGKNKKVLVIYKFMSAKDIKPYAQAGQSLHFSWVSFENYIGLIPIIGAYLRFLFSRSRVKHPCLYRGVDIVPLLNQSMLDDFWECRNLGVYLEVYAASKVLKGPFKQFFYPYENQPWEKIYPLLKHQMKSSTEIVGFQHTGVSYKLLNYFPTALETSCPFFPDRILTVGDTLSKVLQSDAHYPCPIHTGAALRHQKYVQAGSFQFHKPAPYVQGAVAYAFSYDISNYRAILEALIRCFGDSKLKVYLKMHPDYDEDVLIRAMKLHLPGNFILAQRYSWIELSKLVDCIFYDDNSIGLEGLIQGIKTFYFSEADPIYHSERMFGFTLWKTDVDEGAMRTIRDEIEAETFQKTWDPHLSECYIRDYYHAYDGQASYSVFVGTNT